MVDEYPVAATKTAFDIAEALVRLEGAGVSELADYLDVPKSTIHDHLTSLRNRGYVIRDGTEYHISYRFLELGERRRHREPLVDAAGPELESLADETDEYASLVVEENGEAIIIETRRGDRAVRVTVYNGVRMKMHTVAAGKAILTHLPDDRVEEIIETHGLDAATDNTITSRDPLLEELEEIRDQGYALDDEERIEGMRSVASPIIDRSGTVRGCITVYGPTQRVNDERFRETLPQRLPETSNVIEVIINYE